MRGPSNHLVLLDIVTGRWPPAPQLPTHLLAELGSTAVGAPMRGPGNQ